MIKEVETTKDLLKNVTDSEVLDTMYDNLLKIEIYKKYPIDKQLAVLHRDKTDPRRVEYEEYIAKCKKAITALLAK